MKKALIIIGCIAAVIIVAFVAAKFVLGNQSDATFFDLKGGDKVATIKEAVAKRDITKVETSTSKGVLTKTVVYITDPDNSHQAAEDVFAYITYLQEEEGFEAVEAIDTLPYEGGVPVQFAKASAEDGKIIILDIIYDTKGYTLVFTKGEGSLYSK